VLTETEVKQVSGFVGNFEVTTTKGTFKIGSIILSIGSDVYDPGEEYGYATRSRVLTNMELEGIFAQADGDILIDGKKPERVAFVQCVGSRNEKVGNNYCSRICCSYSTKQAIEIKERYPDAVVMCFYIDVRTYGRGFEEMYRRAQEMDITYIRGRVAECGVMPNGDVTIRAEDTFVGKPVQGTFDLVSLSHGMTPCLDTVGIAKILGIGLSEDGFFESKDTDLYPNDATRDGVFLAGAATGAKPIPDCVADGNAVAARVAAFLAGNQGDVA